MFIAVLKMQAILAFSKKDRGGQNKRNRGTRITFPQRKISKDEYPWTDKKELDLLMRFNEYYSEYNRWPPTKVLDAWAADFTEKYKGKTCTVAMLKSKRQMMRKEYVA